MRLSQQKYHSMKYAFFLLLGVVSFSCNKSEGCKDPGALNYDAAAEKENSASCTYSTVTFYASTSTIFGQEVTEVTLEVNEQVIGKIDQLSMSTPSDCDQPGTVTYTFVSNTPKVWLGRYALASGGEVTQEGDFSPSADDPCIKIDVIP